MLWDLDNSLLFISLPLTLIQIFAFDLFSVFFYKYFWFHINYSLTVGHCLLSVRLLTHAKTLPQYYSTVSQLKTMRWLVWVCHFQRHISKIVADKMWLSLLCRIFSLYLIWMSKAWTDFNVAAGRSYSQLTCTLCLKYQHCTHHCVYQEKLSYVQNLLSERYYLLAKWLVFAPIDRIF